MKKAIEVRGKCDNTSHIDGVYGGRELIVAFFVLIFVAVLDVLYLQLYLLAGKDSLVVFSAVMINALGCFLLWLPYVSKKLGESEGGWFNDFLALPDKSIAITFPVFSGFLGEQALGGFLGSVLILTTRQVFSLFGVVAAGLYCFILAALSMAITSISLLRFVVLFTRYSWIVYGGASIVSLLVMFGFYWAGVASVTF